MSINSTVTSDMVSSLKINVKCKSLGGSFSCYHGCHIVLNDGRERIVGFMSGDRLCSLVQEVAQSKIDYSQWADFSSMKTHFERAYIPGGESATEILSVFSVPTEAVDC